MTERAQTIVTAVLLALCAGLASSQLYPRLSVQTVPITVSEPDVTVSISGAVVSPGVYELPWGATAEDAISVAGGLTDDAEVTLVNLAAPMTMGEQLFVPDALVEGGDRLSINTATEREMIALLPGVGPVMASRIVQGRPFSSVDELLNVSGIGEKTLEKLRPYVKP